MEISSDTNVWLDFYIIGGLELPFRLEHVFWSSLLVLIMFSN